MVSRSILMGSANPLRPLEGFTGLSWTGTFSLLFLHPLSSHFPLTANGEVGISLQIERWTRGERDMSQGRVRTDSRLTRSHTHKLVKCPVWKNVHERSVKHFQYVPRTGEFLLLLLLLPYSFSSLLLDLLRIVVVGETGSNRVLWTWLMGRTFKGLESRRRGVYHVACLSMKCYFKVRPSSSSSLPALSRPWTLIPNAPHACANVVAKVGVIKQGTDDRSGNRIYARISYGQWPQIPKRRRWQKRQ
jgi:hypothetical protein